MQSPAENIFLSEVEQNSSTTIPLSTSRPASIASLSQGTTPIPTTIKSASIVPFEVKISTPLLLLIKL